MTGSEEDQEAVEGNKQRHYHFMIIVHELSLITLFSWQHFC